MHNMQAIKLGCKTMMISSVLHPFLIVMFLNEQKCSQQESNLQLALRRGMLYPFNYGSSLRTSHSL